jgi:uncharacterized membrane protein SpoIIM required for sporulation
MALASAPTERAFAVRREHDWNELDTLVRVAHQRGIKALEPGAVRRLPPLYRDVCGDLSRAQAARYSAPLVDYLQALTAQAHTVLYGAGRGRGPTSDTRAGDANGSSRSSLPSWLVAFPIAVRRHHKAMALATLLFFVPFFLGLFMTLEKPELAFRVVPETMLRPLTEAYQHGFADGRGTADDTLMTGFYVNNNVGIALRCFALGIFGGLGSAFTLVQNGLFTGAVVGYVGSQGAGLNILTFIVGHSTFELGAIVIAGGAGLAMGWSVVAPGSRTRLASLQHVGKDVVVIVCGAAVMLFIAALVEGFWSSSSVPIPIKLVVGTANFILVLAYLALAGRGAGATKASP